MAVSVNKVRFNSHRVRSLSVTVKTKAAHSPAALIMCLRKECKTTTSFSHCDIWQPVTHNRKAACLTLWWCALHVEITLKTFCGQDCISASKFTSALHILTLYCCVSSFTCSLAELHGIGWWKVLFNLLMLQDYGIIDLCVDQRERADVWRLIVYSQEKPGLGLEERASGITE